MKEDFLGSFIGSGTRAQLMRVFIFNPSEVLSLSGITKRAGVSSQAAAREVRVLERLGVVRRGKSFAIQLSNGTKRMVQGKQREDLWTLNKDFKHLRPLSSFVHETSPVKYDNIVGALRRGGRISAVILSGAFMGDPTRPADIIVAADPLHERKLETAIKQLEPQFGREIRYAAFSTPEFRYRLTIQDRLIRDTLDFPHLVLLDRTRLL
ncbi:MAG: hypothetical protein JO019_03505 [Candidatus Kaiserbacteria bacterium]|nr:hypothetical protein [Candidatus Kaiserbacteria bacterium]